MNHWQFLNEKLGKDIVSYCIQPFLLPHNGFTPSEHFTSFVLKEMRMVNSGWQGIFNFLRKAHILKSHYSVGSMRSHYFKREVMKELYEINFDFERVSGDGKIGWLAWGDLEDLVDRWKFE